MAGWGRRARLGFLAPADCAGTRNDGLRSGLADRAARVLVAARPRCALLGLPFFVASVLSSCSQRIPQRARSAASRNPTERQGSEVAADLVATVSPEVSGGADRGLVPEMLAAPAVEVRFSIARLSSHESCPYEVQREPLRDIARDRRPRCDFCVGLAIPGRAAVRGSFRTRLCEQGRV
jgi:hypothetical protein